MADNKIDSASPVPNGGELFENLASNFTSIFSIKPMAKYLTGARCVLRMNGRIVGFAFGVTWKINTSVTEIRTIDDYLPHELSPKHISVEGTITGFRIPGFGPGSELLQTDLLSFLHQRYIEIEVRDSQTDNLIFLTRRALVTGRAESVKSGQMAEMVLQFKAIGWADERTPEYPVGYDGDQDTDTFGTQSGTDLFTNPLGNFDPSNIV